MHHLVTDGQPTTAHIWRLAAAKLTVNKQEVAKLEKEGIIHHSASNKYFSLPMVMKADGTWWPCGDHRQINWVTRQDTHPLPNIQDLSFCLHGCKVFIKQDLHKGYSTYYQIPEQEGNIHKMDSHQTFQLLGFRLMLCGLYNAGQFFLTPHGSNSLRFRFGFCLFAQASPGLFIIVDGSTRWGAEAIPLRETSTADCVEVFMAGWIGLQNCTPLTLPGEFVASSEPPLASFLQKLRKKMSLFSSLLR